MQNRVTLKLVGLLYGGTSIGKDIRIEIDIFGKTVAYDAKLKRKENAKPNLPLGSIPIEKKPFSIPVTIRVIERDVLFSDKGQIEAQFKIDLAKSFPQKFTYTILVRESRGFLTKRTAQFEITIEAHTQNRIPTVDDPKWTGRLSDDSEKMLLARLIFGEAENQSREAKIWIGGSVLNRVKAKAWPDTIYDVILQKGQYDPIKTTDKNFKKISDPLASADAARKRAWNESAEVARGLLNGSIKNPTKATHFDGKGIERRWFISNIVPKGKFLIKIDDTSFYWSPN